MSHDPLGYIDSYNLFGFATFDPINGYDPFGLNNLGLTGKIDRIKQGLEEFSLGFASGTGIGAAPGGWLALDRGLLQKKTRDFQLGYGVGETGVGLIEMGIGFSFILGGGGEMGLGIFGAPESLGTSLVLVPSGFATSAAGVGIATEGGRRRIIRCAGASKY